MFPLLVPVEHGEPARRLVVAEIAREFGRHLEVDRHDVVVQVADVGRGVRAELASLDVVRHFAADFNLQYMVDARLSELD